MSEVQLPTQPQPQPPSAEVPYWRDFSGRRTTVGVLLAGRDLEARRALLAVHVRSVEAILSAAASASLSGRDRELRTLASHASRLCGELAGLWPSGSDQPLA